MPHCAPKVCIGVVRANCERIRSHGTSSSAQMSRARCYTCSCNPLSAPLSFARRRLHLLFVMTAVAVSVTRETDGATDGGGGSATWLEVVGDGSDDVGRIGGGPIGFFSLPSSHLSHSYYRRQESGMPRPSSPRVSQLLPPAKTQDCHLKCFHGSNQRRNGKVLWAKR